MIEKKYRLYFSSEREPKEYDQEWEAIAVMDGAPTSKLPAALFLDFKLIKVRIQPAKSNYYDDR